MSNEEVKEVWQNYWTQNKGNELSFDTMSATIFSEIVNICGDVKGKKILEAGCGRGLISARLAELGAEVYLLDISPQALQIAREYFIAKNLSASFTHGDILDLPYEESTFDIVWNAGVMEHFENALQKRAIRSISRVIKRGGLFITFNPSAKAFFYTLGKKSAERKGKWPYGPEYPVRSLKEDCAAEGLTVLKEYALCFRENLSYLSYVSKHLRSIVKFLFKPLPEDALLRVFGGYLLATIARKGER